MEIAPERSQKLCFHDEMREWRRDIHAHPELAFEETRTAEFVADTLRSFSIDVATGIGKTGVVGTIARGGSGRTIGLRADMDALAIEEQNNFAHRSQYEGKMHACGHDGHTVMLLGAAKRLAETFEGPGTINFIFQPAEEGAGGADVMIKDGLFSRFPCEAVFGMHNAPATPVGTFITRPGPFLAGFDIVDVTITGKGTHAAAPEKGIDPILIASNIIAGTPALIAKQFPAVDPIVFSITGMEAGGGGVYNVIPEKAFFKGTVRHFNIEYGGKIARSYEQFCKGHAAAYGGDASVNYRTNYPPLVNTGRETDYAVAAARSVAGPEYVNGDHDVIMGAEDFAFMLQKRPGCYVMIGNGTESEGGGCMVHNPEYDFNDEILSLGVRYWEALACQFLSEHNQINGS